MSESFERCDTDGFVSQFSQQINANLAETQAEIADNCGLSNFYGLYDGDRRVRAKMQSFDCRYSHSRKTMWLVHEDDPVYAARKWIPIGPDSRIQKQLGLKERREAAPAWATIKGTGRGMGSLASCRVIVFRRGDVWGSDATVI